MLGVCPQPCRSGKPATVTLYKPRSDVWQTSLVPNNYESYQHSCETACNIKITENLVLFGIDSTVITDTIFDLIILLAKQYLYRCKFEHSVPLVSVFWKQLKQRYKLEEYNSKITFTENAFNARWHCYQTLLLEDWWLKKKKRKKREVFYQMASEDVKHQIWPLTNLCVALR